jgi:hypothetical protein
MKRATVTFKEKDDSQGTGLNFPVSFFYSTEDTHILIQDVQESSGRDTAFR